MEIGLEMARTSVAETVRRLRVHIEQEGLGPQDRLAPERVLAEHIGCSRTTLRLALDALEKERLIWRHVGQGTFVGERPRAEPIRPLLLFETTTPEEMLEARLLIEPAIAGAAALNASAPDVEALRQFATASSGTATWQDYERVDNLFHMQVAQAAGNPLLVSFLGTLSSVRSRVKWQREHGDAFRRAGETEYSARQGDMHLAIAEAIARGDPAGAQKAMLEHLRCIHRLMMRNRAPESEG